jgi:2-oxoacid:acceptor oxidoreductase delta subunit (pyruvate/2-ketoisovalerate family)
MTLKKRSGLSANFKIKSWRDFPAMNASIGNMLHNLTGGWRFIKPIYEEKVPACQSACPAGNDIEGWIKIVQQGDYEKAYWHLKREQPFPAILGRVCFQFCENTCNRAEFDQSVRIKEMERFVGDRVPAAHPHPDLPQYNGKSIAVVGSGPAGMSAAYFGRLLGFKISVFEKLPQMGGILRVGIPAYRLPREIVQAEFEGLAGMGMSLHPATAIGSDIALTALKDEFDYVFLATGRHTSLKLRIEGEDRCRRIMSGLALLHRIAMQDEVDLGKKVVVIGGGNTAIDAARTALRLGCDVTIIYRRSPEEMPAHAEEVALAREEGIKFRFLAAVEEIKLADDGTVRELVCCKMQLGPPDESGRRRPVRMAGAQFEVIADSILTAIGEAPEFDYLSGLVKTGKWVVPVDNGLKAAADQGQAAGIFAGGDMIDIPRTVVHAVAAGKRAAIAMDCDRKGTDYNQVLSEITVGDGAAVSFSKYMGWQPVNPVRRDLKQVVGHENIVYDYFQKTPPVPKKIQSSADRKKSFKAYSPGFSEDEAGREAARCLHCGRCTECDNCLIFCPDMSVLKQRNGVFGYSFDYDYCKGCGICFTECPRQAITMIDEETPVGE